MGKGSTGDLYNFLTKNGGSGPWLEKIETNRCDVIGLDSIIDIAQTRTCIED